MRNSVKKVTTDFGATSASEVWKRTVPLYKNCSVGNSFTHGAATQQLKILKKSLQQSLQPAESMGGCAVTGKDRGSPAGGCRAVVKSDTITNCVQIALDTTFAANNLVGGMASVSSMRSPHGAEEPKFTNQGLTQTLYDTSRSFQSTSSRPQSTSRRPPSAPSYRSMTPAGTSRSIGGGGGGGGVPPSWQQQHIERHAPNISNSGPSSRPHSAASGRSRRSAGGRSGVSGSSSRRPQSAKSSKQRAAARVSNAFTVAKELLRTEAAIRQLQKQQVQREHQVTQLRASGTQQRAANEWVEGSCAHSAGHPVAKIYHSATLDPKVGNHLATGGEHQMKRWLQGRSVQGLQGTKWYAAGPGIGGFQLEPHQLARSKKPAAPVEDSHPPLHPPPSNLLLKKVAYSAAGSKPVGAPPGTVSHQQDWKTSVQPANARGSGAVAQLGNAQRTASIVRRVAKE